MRYLEKEQSRTILFRGPAIQSLNVMGMEYKRFLKLEFLKERCTCVSQLLWYQLCGQMLNSNKTQDIYLIVPQAT